MSARPMFALHDFDWPKADREEVSEELRAEMVDDLYAQYADDDAKRREAVEWIVGTFDEADTLLALFDMDGTDPDKLAESGVLTRLYQRAAVVGPALAAKLREMAEQAVDGAA